MLFSPIRFCKRPCSRDTQKETEKRKLHKQTYTKLEMWANAQRDGRPAEYSWRPLFNAAKFG